MHGPNALCNPLLGQPPGFLGLHLGAGLERNTLNIPARCCGMPEGAADEDP